jgi:hypothetical protein
MKQCALLFLFVFVTAGAMSADEWYVSYQNGKDEFNDKHWSQAIQLLNDAIHEKPGSVQKALTYSFNRIPYFPYIYRGCAYFELGDKSAARADLMRAENRDAEGEEKDLLDKYVALLGTGAPTAPTVDPLYVEGKRLFDQRSYKEAVDKLGAVGSSSAQYADAQKMIRLAQDALKKTDTALRTGDESSKNPVRHDMPDPAHERSVQPVKPDIQPQSENASTTPTGTAVQTDTVGQALLGLAKEQFAAGHYRAAKGAFTEYRGLGKESAEVTQALGAIATIEGKIRSGISLYFRGNYADAIRELASASERGGDNPHAFALLACAYASSYLLGGSEDGTLKSEALTAFNKARAINARYTLDRTVVSPQVIALLGQ